MGGTDSLSPVIHLQLSGNNQADQEEDAQVLQEIADRALKDSHILFTVHKKSALDKVQQPSSLRLDQLHVPLFVHRELIQLLLGCSKGLFMAAHLSSLCRP